MELSVRVICRPHLSAGFALAGLPVTPVGEADAAAAVKQMAEDRRVGLILIDEGLFRALPHDLMARLDRQALPILTPFPAPAWDLRAEAEAYIVEILRQAIGYRVRAR